MKAELQTLQINLLLLLLLGSWAELTGGVISGMEDSGIEIYITIVVKSAKWILNN